MLSYWTMSRNSYFLFFLRLFDLRCFKSLVRINPRLVVRFSCFFNLFVSCWILMHLINLLLMLVMWYFVRTGLVLVMALVWAWLALVKWNFAKILLALIVWTSLWAWTFLRTWSKLRVIWIEKYLKVFIFSSDVFLFILVIIFLFKSFCWWSGCFSITSDTYARISSSNYSMLLFFIIFTHTIVTKFSGFYPGPPLLESWSFPFVTFLLHLTIVFTLNH